MFVIKVKGITKNRALYKILIFPKEPKKNFGKILELFLGKDIYKKIYKIELM